MRNTTILMTLALLSAIALGGVATTSGKAPAQTTTATTCALPPSDASDRQALCVIFDLPSVPGAPPVNCTVGGVEAPCDLPLDTTCMVFQQTETHGSCGGENVWLGKFWSGKSLSGSSIRFYGEAGNCSDTVSYTAPDLSAYERGWFSTWDNAISSGKSYTACGSTLFEHHLCDGSSFHIGSGQEADAIAGIDNDASSICWA